MKRHIVKTILLASLCLTSCSFLSLYALGDNEENISGEIAIGLSNEATNRAMLNLLSNLDEATSIDISEVDTTDDGIVTNINSSSIYYSNSHSFSEISTSINHIDAGVYYQENIEEEKETLLDEESGLLLTRQEILKAPDIAFYNEADQYLVTNWVGQQGYKSLASYDVFAAYQSLDLGDFTFGYDGNGQLLAMKAYRQNSFAPGNGSVYIYQEDYQFKLYLSNTLENPILEKVVVKIDIREGDSSLGLTLVEVRNIEISIAYGGSFEEPSIETFMEEFPEEGLGYPRSSFLELARIVPQYDTTGQTIISFTIDESSRVLFQSWSHYSLENKTSEIVGIASISDIEADYYAIVVNNQIYDPWNREVVDEILTPLSGRDFNDEEIEGISFIIVEGETYFLFEEEFAGGVMEMEATLDFSEATNNPTYSISKGGWV